LETRGRPAHGRPLAEARRVARSRHDRRHHQVGSVADALCAEYVRAAGHSPFRARRPLLESLRRAGSMSAATHISGATNERRRDVRPQQSGLEHVSADTRPWLASCVHLLLEREELELQLSRLTSELGRASPIRAASPSPEHSIDPLARGESRRSIERGVEGHPSSEGLPAVRPCRCPSRLSERARRAHSRAGTRPAQRAKSRPGCETPRRGFATNEPGPASTPRDWARAQSRSSARR
jgi:hypothetical protein